MRKPLLAAPPAAMLTLAATTSTLTQIVALRSHRLSRYSRQPNSFSEAATVATAAAFFRGLRA